MGVIIVSVLTLLCAIAGIFAATREDWAFVVVFAIAGGTGVFMLSHYGAAL